VKVQSSICDFARHIVNYISAALKAPEYRLLTYSAPAAKTPATANVPTTYPAPVVARSPGPDSTPCPEEPTNGTSKLTTYRCRAELKAALQYRLSPVVAVVMEAPNG
jgi:hypothetical protein